MSERVSVVDLVCVTDVVGEGTAGMATTLGEREKVSDTEPVTETVPESVNAAVVACALRERVGITVVDVESVALVEREAAAEAGAEGVTDALPEPVNPGEAV